MIDRERVRELAVKRKHFQAALAAFLEVLDPDVEQMECPDVDSLSTEELDRLDDIAWKALDEFAGFSHLVELRMRTRGRISGEMSGLIDRLERYAKAVFLYLSRRLSRYRLPGSQERAERELRFRRIEERVMRQTAPGIPHFAIFGRGDCSDPEREGGPG